MGLLKEHRTFGKSIYIGSDRIGVAAQTADPIVHVVRNEEEDVEAVGVGREGVAGRKSRAGPAEGGTSDGQRINEIPAIHFLYHLCILSSQYTNTHQRAEVPVRINTCP